MQQIREGSIVRLRKGVPLSAISRLFCTEYIEKQLRKGGGILKKLEGKMGVVERTYPHSDKVIVDYGNFQIETSKKHLVLLPKKRVKVTFVRHRDGSFSRKKMEIIDRE
jgi:hypothetical protein